MTFASTLKSIRASRAWIHYFVLAISLMVTIFGAASVWILADVQERSRFENAVQSTQDTVRDRLETYTLLLRSTGGLFSAKLGSNPGEFRAFVQSLQLQERYPGVRGIGWSIRLTPEQVPLLVDAMRERVQDDFHVWPLEPQRNEYHSIVYLEPPDARNRAAIGFDMHSDSVRAEAMDRARDTGQPAASGVVRLVQEIDADTQPGFLIYLPVYRYHGTPKTLEERRAMLTGFVYTPFRINDLLEGIFGTQTHPHIEFEVYDGTPSEATLLFRSGVRPTDAGPARMTAQSALNVAGRSWSLRYFSRPEFESATGRDSGLGIALVGTLVSVLLFGLTRAQTLARENAEHGAADLAKREAALRISETRFRSLFTQSPVTIQLFAPDGTLIAVNDAWEKLWQMPRQQVQGYNLLRDPKLMNDSAFASMRKAFDGDIVEIPPTWLDPGEWGKPGRARWVEAFVYPIKSDDARVSEVVLMLVDVTDRLEAERRVQLSEERYRSLVSATAQIVWTTDPNGAVIEDIPTWRDFTGQTQEELLGNGWAASVHPDDRERVGRVWQRSLESQSSHEQEFRVRRHDGEWRDVFARAVPVLEGTGNVREWVGTCADITDRKRAETERDFLLASERGARTEAERANKLKDEFLATMSHELRTPLNAILGWAQLLRTSTDEDDIASGLETIERNAKAQARLVDDLLDVSRIIAGKLRLDSHEVNLQTVIASAIESAKPLLDEKTIRLTLDLDPATPAAMGDAHRLQQIIWNILTNAVKFTPAGGRVSVALRGDGDHAVITVTDTGCGIPPDFLPHVFDRFRQADASTTRRFGGLGLGLGIVRHLVELHEGTVRAISEGENCGSTFIITLPVIARAEHAVMHVEHAVARDGMAKPQADHIGKDDAGTPKTQAAVAAMDRAALNSDASSPLKIAQYKARDLLAGLRVLVVEDDPDSRELMISVIEMQGGQAQTATSTSAGVESFVNQRPDVLVSDISMPGEDGYVLIARVRALEQAQNTHPRVPAIALTALARSEDHTRAIVAGFDLHISKPIENRLLVESIAGLAGRMKDVESTSPAPR